MENDNKILCSAKFKTKFNVLFLVFMLLWAGAAIGITLLTEKWESYSSYNYKTTYNSKTQKLEATTGDIKTTHNWKTYLGIEVESFIETYDKSAKVGERYTLISKEKNTGGMLAVNGIVLAFIMIPVILRAINISIAKKASLELEENQINGHIRSLYGITSIKINTPIEHIDNVLVADGLMDKYRGGKTLRIGSNSGVIKFHYVQNAEEFAQAAMKRIGEVKKSAHVPQSAPVQNVTGSDAMEKINSLKQMLDSGLISQEDFDRKKADILSKM